MTLTGRVAAVTLEATTGWRWVWRELSALGFDVRLADPAQVKAFRGRTKKAKTDRLDARWLCLLLAKAMLPESWLPPAEIQMLRDQTRLRKALADDRTRWAQRLHALLTHEGWPCQRARLLTAEGRRWAGALELPPAARAQVDCLLRLITAVESELRPLESELRRFARAARRCQALQTIFGVGPILACHLLAALGEDARFRRARQAVRAAGLDPVLDESGQTKRRVRLAKHGSPALRWALVQAAQHADRASSPTAPSMRGRSGASAASPARHQGPTARRSSRRAPSWPRQAPAFPGVEQAAAAPIRPPAPQRVRRDRDGPSTSHPDRPSPTKPQLATPAPLIQGPTQTAAANSSLYRRLEADCSLINQQSAVSRPRARRARSRTPCTTFPCRPFRGCVERAAREPRLSTIVRLSRGLQVSPADLLVDVK